MKKSITKKLINTVVSLCVVLAFAVNVFAEGNTQRKVKREGQSANSPFAVENMFPGDSVTQDFVVNVTHKNPVTLYYHTDIHTGYEKLAEVLMTKIEIPQKDIILYDGLMKDMPQALEHNLAADEKDVLYRITVYLDTGVGNDYMYKELKADFRWWYLEDETEPAPDKGDSDGSDKTDSAGTAPDTGDNTNLLLPAAVMAVSGAAVIILLVLMKKREKEEGYNG